MDRSRQVDDDERTPAVLAAVERGAGGACATCRRVVCGHEVVMSFVLGFKGAVRCLGCLAGGLAREVGELRGVLLDHIDHRDCWRAGWRRAGELEGAKRCEAASGGASARSEGRVTQHVASARAAESRSGAGRAADATWDAGDMGCGDLVLELRQRMAALRPGQVLELTARDPGAPADLPAWCGLTGHVLLEARHPAYRIRCRND